jgi:hypothetical protein
LTPPESPPENGGMKNFPAASLVMAALALAAAAPAQAQVRGPQLGDARIEAFIRDAGHLEAVRGAIAAFEPTALQARCKDIRVVRSRNWMQLEAPVFDPGVKAPKSAAWQETWEVSACGAPAFRSVGFVARPGQGITPLPMFPGQSLADLKLQVAAGQEALDVVAPAALPCSAANRPSPIQVINSIVTERANEMRGIWSERWTVAGCNKTAEIDVDFAPNPQGQQTFRFKNRVGPTPSR